MSLNGTIAPWLVGGFAILALAMLAQTLKAWREAKRSPYFFLRVQAQKRLRQYSTSALVLILLTGAVGVYGWDETPDQTPRVALLVNNKPVAAASADQSSNNETEQVPVMLVLDPTSSLIDRSVVSSPPLDLTTDTTALGLPTQYNRVEPSASLQENTNLGVLSFSTAVTGQYQPVNPRDTFSEGSFTLYGTFAYAGMVDGLAWSWVWLRDGVAINGGNELWKYGSEGPGYVFLNPEEGFAAGQYTLGIWVNGRLMAESQFQVTTSAAAQR
jgi:hypothetical protein